LATRIQLCGGLTVEIDGERVESALPGRQGRLLLAYLVLNRGRPVRRDELIDVLWEDHPPNAPDAGLASLLTRLRQALGRDAVPARGRLSLQLAPDAWVDVEAARAAARDAESALRAGEPRRALGRAEAALELTELGFLPELESRWIDDRRTELDELRSEALEAVARAALSLGAEELGAAERAGEELIERQPYRESGYAALMEAYARRGNVAEALLVYDRLRVLLRDELGVAPAASVTALHERLLREGEPEAAPVLVPVSAPGRRGDRVPLPGLLERSEARAFVGRAAELEELRDHWARVPGGQGGVVLLAGDAGIGKTRLTARLASEAHGAGATVLYGRVDEDTVVPYQPFVEALRHYVAHAGGLAGDPDLAAHLDALAPLIPELGREAAPAPAAEPENRRYQLFEGVSALLAHAARERPLLVVVEDLHWAGRPTLLLLRQVVRQGEGAPLMLLATYRDDEVAADAPLARLLAGLRREAVCHELALGGLDPGATAALVAAGDGELARRVHEQTAGNPFFIEETLRSLSEAPDEARVPQGVKDVIARRLSRLPPPAVETLTAAAVLGRDFGLQDLEAMLDRPSDAVLDGLEEALRAGLVLEQPGVVDRFSFIHALVRETLYERPATSRRVRLHLRAGEALERAGAGPAELAHHYFAAREVGGSEHALRWARAAAAQAIEAHAYEEAAAHYERALQLVPPGDEGARADLLLALGAVRWQGGEPGARDAFAAAEAIARRRDMPERLARAVLGAGGRFYVPRGLDEDYVGRLEEALAALDAAPSGLRARLLARLAEHLSLTAPDDRPARLGEEAVAAARSSGDDDALIDALLGQHAALLGAEHLDARQPLVEEAIAQATRQGSVERAALAHHWRLYDLAERGDLDEARRAHATLRALAGELGQPLYRHSELAWRGVLALLGGRFDVAERLAHESLRIAQRAGAPEARGFFLAQLAAIRRDQGRLAELLPALERLAAGGPDGLAWGAVLPLALLDAGEAERARAAYEAALAAIPRGLYRLTALAALAEACHALGDRPRADGLYAELAPHAERLVQSSFSGSWGSAHRFLGLLSAVAGRPDQAAEHYAAALARHEALEAAPLAARTRCEQAELLVAGGDAAAAAPLLDAVEAAAAELGMRGLTARAQRLRSGHVEMAGEPPRSDRARQQA
jgi:pentatricopeptide repeat protein